MMNFTGALFKRVFFVDILASIPLCLLSMYGIYYAIDRLKLLEYPKLLALLLVMPNFGVWTSIHSKEAVACFFLGIIAVLIVNFINGNLRIKLLDIVAFYLCLIFKPQYFLFVFQALLYLWLVKKFYLRAYGALLLGVFMLSCNVVVIYIFRDMIDILAQGMYVHFISNSPDAAQSTRSADPWFQPYGFFKEMPYGMFIAFWGPTLPEMLRKPAQLISGLESLMIVLLFFLVWIKGAVNFILRLIFIPKVFFSYFVVMFGILFVHYPFGYLNPGSAIRYRENFYLLFIILLFYLLKKNKYIKIDNWYITD
ncbi:hypothetical protein [Sphingobacterium wenxiniae]|nr:hypothetical protein [Sphingobacterium wenxiniae]